MAGSSAFRVHLAAVPRDNGSDDEEPETGAFDPRRHRAGDAVEALEHPLQRRVQRTERLREVDLLLRRERLAEDINGPPSACLADDVTGGAEFSAQSSQRGFDIAGAGKARLERLQSCP